MLLSGVSLFFSVPAVRTYVALKAVEHINNRYDVDIRIAGLNLFPLGRIDAQKVLIKDHHGDTLIYTGRLITGSVNPLSMKENKFLFSLTTLEKPYLNLVTYEGENEDNLNIFIKKLEGGESQGGKPFYLKIARILWSGGRFRVSNYNIKHEPIYRTRHIDAEINDFVIDGKNLYAQLENMAFTDQYDLNVKQLKSDFSYTPDSMRFENLLIKTDSSELKGVLGFDYQLENLKHFFDEVELNGRLTGHIAAYDMNKLAGGMFSAGRRVLIQTELGWVINELELNAYEMTVPGTAIASEGDMILYELTDLDHFGFNAAFKRLRADYVSLENFIPGTTEKYIPGFVKNAGMMVVSGDFEYQPGFVEAALHTLSEQGNLKSGFSIKFKETVPYYKGFFETTSLHIGKLLSLKDFGKIKGGLQVEGSGFDLKEMQSVVSGKAGFVEFRGYAYNNLDLSARINYGKITGSAYLNDAAIKTAVEGTAQLNGKQNSWQFDTQVFEWDLYKTGWTGTDTLSVISFNAAADLNGNDINNLSGTLHVKDLVYKRSQKVYGLKEIQITSAEKQNEKIIEITSDRAINGYLRGRFRINRLTDMYKQILGTVFTGLKPEGEFKDEYVRFKFALDSDLLEILDPSIEYTKNTLVKGSISGKDNYIHTDLKSDELKYAGVTFHKTELTIDNRNPIYNLYIKSDSIDTGLYTFSSLRAINLTIRDTVYMKLKAKGGDKASDEFNLSAKYHLDTLQTLHFRFTDSYMTVKNKKWTFSQDHNANRIDYSLKNDSLVVNRLAVHHQNESVSLSGYDTKTRRDMFLKVKELVIGDILPQFEGFRFGGILNLDVKSGKNPHNAFYNAGGSISGLTWNDLDMGDMFLNLKTVSAGTMFLDITQLRKGDKLLSANGYVDINSGDLDVNLQLDKFPLKPFNELMEDIFSNIRGSVTGHTNITGNLNKPEYNGLLNLFDVGLTVDELNVDFMFENGEQVKVENDRFVFNNRFYDTKYHSKGVLKGLVSFYNFTNWYIDLDIDAANLLVLDTEFTEEALYYGTAFADGRASIEGYVNKIKIDAAVKSNKGTRIFIPLSDVETIGEDDFIKFYTEKEYRKKKSKGKTFRRIYEGLELNLDIDVTQDAEIEIVLDREFGSKLISKGEGTVLMEINTEGKFNMWGAYQVVDGKYIFRYAGIIEKEFDVEPGSILVWNGDPFRADLDIKATYYIPAADITPLLKESEIYTRRVPVKVFINIKGDLMKPRIEFELELPDASPVIRSEVEYALRDADTRMLQVISLLYSGNFISPDVIKFDNRTAVEGNLSERVLSVFNTLLENDVFNVKLDYVPDRQDPETNVKTDSRVGLTIQTKINKRIYINGKLAMPVGRYTKSSVSGDVEVDIWLNESGTIQLRIYNKRTEIEYANQEESYTRGGGISFQVDFDTFKELLQKMGIDIKAE
jgi:hypothetical protein